MVDKFTKHTNAVVRLLSEDLKFEDIERVVQVLTAVRQSEGVVYVAGNGGSAANASHCAAHLNDVGILAVCLTDNVPLLTARSNDSSYGEALVQSTARRLRENDAVMVFSCSGKSPNIVALLNQAKTEGANTIALFGFRDRHRQPGDLNASVILNSADYGAIEDVHRAITHIVKDMLEQPSSSRA